MEKINSFQGGHRWLSNFWIVPVMFEGHQYRSVEHAYVASKTTDPAIREQVRLIETPGAAKRFGRKIELRPDWEDVKLGFMEIMLRSKFRQERLCMLLISTGDAVLEEGNSWGDTFWGTCRGNGHNHLGKLLMKLRAEFVPAAVTHG